MTHRDLVEQIAADVGLAKSQARSIVEAVFTAIANAASSGENVSIPGFGKFKVRATEARVGRNPNTGATIQIAASRKFAG